MTERFEICVVGAGVIGLAVARQLATSGKIAADKILVLEQEASFGQHTSSRNSEVIHAGLYYPDNSLKARLCVRGKQLLYEYCAQHDIPHRKTGKLVVAQDAEIAALETLQQQAMRNGVSDTEIIDAAALQQMEPQVTGSAALFSPSSGIIDSHAYMQSLLNEVESSGALFVRKTRIEKACSANNGFRVTTQTLQGQQSDSYDIECRVLINCAGLDAMNVAERIECDFKREAPRLYLCKGDYFHYNLGNPFTHLVYPLPEKNTRGLGIHATLDMGGQCRFGPDSQYVDAINYDVSAAKATQYAEAIKRYFPAIDAAQLQPSYAGIRPKLSAVGEPAQDFVIQFSQDCAADEHSGTMRTDAELVQLFGIESPGLTASLAIGELITTRLLDQL